MRLSLASLPLLALFLVVAACSQASSHPPASDGCEGVLCYPGSNGGHVAEAGAADTGPVADAGADSAPVVDAAGE